MPDLPVIDGVTIPEDELSWKFSTSGGPGGQHANRSATRAEVSFAVDSSRALSAPQKQRVAAELASRIRGGTLTVSADDTRSQARNRELARRRMAELLAAALTPEAPRKPTRPTAASRRRRVDAKRARGTTKEMRRKPDPE